MAMPPRPSIDDVLMIDPPPFSCIVWTTARMPRKQPRVLTRQTSSNSATGCVVSSAKRRMPALLTRTFTGPYSSFARFTIRSHDASSLTSCCSKTAALPSSAASASPGSVATSAMTTVAPASTKARAIAAPWPCAPPVTIACFPLNLDMSQPLNSCRSALGSHLKNRVRGEPLGRIAIGEPRADVVYRPELLGHRRRRQHRERPAVGDEHLSGDGGRPGPGEERHQRGDVLRA